MVNVELVAKVAATSTTEATEVAESFGQIAERRTRTLCVLQLVLE